MQMALGVLLLLRNKGRGWLACTLMQLNWLLKQHNTCMQHLSPSSNSRNICWGL